MTTGHRIVPTDRSVGLLLSLAPSAAAAASLPVLLRIAVDAEQMGAARLHLPPDLPDAARAVAELRARTRMVLTTDPDGAAATLCDRPGSLFREVVLDPADPAILVAAVAGLAADARIGPGQILSVSGRGRAGMAVMLAAVAAGLQVRVGSADSAHSADPADGPAPARELGPDPARDDIGLIARAAGIARIAGRQLLGGAAARELLGVG